MRMKRVFQVKKIPMTLEPIQVAVGADAHILGVEISEARDVLTLAMSVPVQGSPLSRTLWVVEENGEIPASAADAEFIAILNSPGDVDNSQFLAAVFLETQDQALSRASSTRR